MSREKETSNYAKRLKQMELLNRIGLQIVSVFDRDRLLSTVTMLTKKILGYANCAVLIADGETLILTAAYHFPQKVRGMKIPFGKGVVGRCARLEKIINIGDVSRCSYYIPSGLKGIKSEIAIPIVFGKEFLGVLTIESNRKKAFTKEDEQVLSTLSSQLGVAIRNARLTRSKNREMELLQKTGLNIVSKIDRDTLLSTTVELICDSLGYDNGAIFLPLGEKLILNAQSRFPEKVLGLEIKRGAGAVGRCAKRKKVINIGDVPKCSYYISSGLAGIQSALAMPILFENRLMGVLATESRKRAAYKEDDVRLLNILCSQIGVALRNAEMLAELQRRAITDGLTGLYNHRYFVVRLEQETLRARRYGRDLSLILIDLDNFKLVNDFFSHLKGDEVLMALSSIILRNIRKTDDSTIMKDVEIDIPVRYGGDEFMLILPETPIQGAIIVASRLRVLVREEINQKIPLVKKDGERLLVTASLGVARLKPDEKSNELISRVDQAMYESKKRGKDQVFWID